MRASLPVLVLTALCAAYAQSQTFTFAHVDDSKQIHEIATIIHSISGAPIEVGGETQKTMNVQGTPDQLALVGWLFNELDSSGRNGATHEYRMPSGDDNIVRIFYIPFAQSLQEVHEVATLVRSIADIRLLFACGAEKAVVMRGTADQTMLAEWLFNELAKPASPGSPPYHLLKAREDTVQVFYVTHTKTVQDFQEVAVLVRSVSNTRRAFTYNRPRALVLRGTSDQISLTQWLLKELDESVPHKAASTDYRMTGEGSENVVRVFHLPQTLTAEDFHQIAVTLHTQVGVPVVFTFNAPRAMALRGTVTQIEQAAHLIGENNKSN